jgi:hypothetical protein
MTLNGSGGFDDVFCLDLDPEKREFKGLEILKSLGGWFVQVLLQYVSPSSYFLMKDFSAGETCRLVSRAGRTYIIIRSHRHIRT